MTAKSKKKKSPKRAVARAATLSSKLRRLALWLITSSAIGTQISSCGLIPRFEESGYANKGTDSPALAPTRFASCPEFFAGGVAPRVSAMPKLRELCYNAFAVLHNGSTRTPVFVAERLNRQSLLQAQGEQRTDRFFADARLPRGERAELNDYKGSGFARGHMAPAGNMPTPDAMAQSFSLANMVPQNSKQNSGPWAKIEKDTRNYVLRAQGDVYVITGPVFEPKSETIGANHVNVPAQLFKLVYDATTQRAWAHWQPNSEQAKAGRPISYGELEQRIGMELLPGVPIK